jgi:hypothetical protein
LERRDLRRSAVGPREADARAQVNAVRNTIIPRAEKLLDGRIVKRLGREAVSVETQAVLQLQVVGRTIGIAERHAADPLALAASARRELPREDCRTSGLEIGE